MLTMQAAALPEMGALYAKSAALYSSVHTLLQPLPQTFSLQSRSIRTIPMYWMHFIWTATISLCCPPNAPP